MSLIAGRPMTASVMMPNVAFPPRRPQNSSGFSCGVAVRTAPSPVTTVSARTWSTELPNVDTRGPIPPPDR